MTFFSTNRTFTRKALPALLVLISGLLLSFSLSAQTKGVIFDPATGTGSTVLDPNGDGYVSATTAGFTTSDIGSASELSFQYIPQLTVEPSADILRAPSCGFTDFNDDGTKTSIGIRYSSPYLIFRFRMSNSAPNSKGYSILVDADGKFGSSGSNADPDYIAPGNSSATFGNPGFEYEIVLETNFRVAIYNVDGANAISPVLIKEYAGHTNYQKALAYSSSCGTATFLDFFVNINDIPTSFGGGANFSTTSFRYVANTVMSPHSAIAGPVSDVGGINDATYSSNAATLWNILVTGQPGTTGGTTNSMSNTLTTVAPTVYAPLYNGGASVTVLNNDPSAATIVVYRIRSGITTTLGTITGTVASGSTGTFTLTGGVTHQSGDQIYATAQATGENVSSNSNTVTVTSCSAKSTAPIVTCITNRGMQGTSVYSGATIKIYFNDGRLYTTITGGTTASGGTYAWSFDPTGGNTASPCASGSPSAEAYGSFLVTATSGTLCESNMVRSGSRTQSGGSMTACTPPSSPTITSYNSGTGKITGTAAVTGDTVVIFKNGAWLANVATGTGTSFTYTGSFASTDSVLVGEFTGGTGCMSSRVLAITPPVVSSPIYNGATSVTGTAVTAPAGTYVVVYKTGSTTRLGSTTVDVSGNWTATVSALATGNVIYAVDSAGTNKSASSNQVTVVAAPSSTDVPAVTGINAGVVANIIEKGTQVSGTLPGTQAAGTVKLYEDGTLVGSVSTSASATTWTVTGISSTMLVSGVPVDNYLYAGGVLKATFTPSGGTESNYGASKTVQCSAPLTDRTITPGKYSYCTTEYAQVKIASSESDVLYTMIDGSSNEISPSLSGNGSTLTLTTSSKLSSSMTAYVKSMKISPVSCSNSQTDTATLREDCPATYTANTFASNYVFNLGTVLANVSDPDGSITAASLATGSLPPGSTLNSSTGQLTVSDVAAFVAGGTNSYSSTINTTDNHTMPTGNGLTVYGSSVPSLSLSFASPLPVKLTEFTGNWADSVVNLKWTTASEINNSYFDVERSINGIDFYSIGTRDGHGNSQMIFHYNFTDMHPLYGVSYYRLKQVDFDGNSSYSNVVMLRKESRGTTSVWVYPNPLPKPSLMHVMVQTQDNEVVSTNLVDVAGHVVSAQEPQIITGRKEVVIDTKNIKPGLYFIRVQTSKDIITQKIEIIGR